jgi:acetate kinase
MRLTPRVTIPDNEALQVFVHRVRKYLGAYYVHLQGKVDAIVFSAGIGEHSSFVRSEICQGLDGLGIKLDTAKNKSTAGHTADVSARESTVRVYVIPTDEELLIARDTAAVARVDT